MNNKCKICGSSDTEIKTGTEIFEYKGKKIQIPDYTKTVCHNCGESVADSDSVKKSIPILRDAQRLIDGLLTGKEIKSIRLSLHMTQDELSQLLGGGEKAFARYETGKVVQSKPMDNLLRILKKYPEVIEALEPKPGKEICFPRTKVDYSPYKDEIPFGYIIQGNNLQRVA